MSTQLNALLAALKTPTQSAWDGAKTTRPLPAVAAPTNFLSMLRVEAMSTQLKEGGGVRGQGDGGGGDGVGGGGEGVGGEGRGGGGEGGGLGGGGGGGGAPQAS